MSRSDPTPRSFSADQLRAALRDIGEPARPDYLTDIIAKASRTRQRPRWMLVNGSGGQPLPSFLSALSDADAVGRRRQLLIAAALLIALAVASAAAVGAWRLLQRDPVDELSLEPPADLPAFVLSSYERLPQLPPVALTWRDSDSGKGRIYVDGSGAVRFDQFASADATAPSGYRILSGNSISGVATVGSDKVWVDDDGAIENPREWIRGVLHAPDGPPGCEMERDANGAAGGTAAAGWRYVGVEHVAGRPTHHVTCGGGDVWIDIETRLILRTQGPAVDDAGRPIPVESTEVTEIAFGEQPAALFQAPEGLASWSGQDYTAYICARNLPNEIAPGISECPTAEAEPTPAIAPSLTPTPTPDAPPGTRDCAAPASDATEPIGPLSWTPERMKEDWPAPVRPEPAGGGGDQPVPLTYLDPVGDSGSTADRCVDIRGVMADTSRVTLKLASTVLPGVAPSDQWIAYGIVTDDDRDGVADWRYGIDNIPADGADAAGDRGWRTNLHTGQTDAGPEHGDPVWPNGGGFKAGYPGSEAVLQFCGFAGETTGGPAATSGWCSKNELDVPFYAWASTIVDGRVVATDYAPDAGWLVATRGAWPGGTFLLGDPYPRLAMTVPDGWTTHAPLGWFHRSANVLKRVACAGLPRGFPDDESPPTDCARLSISGIDHPGEYCDPSSGPPADASFDDIVTFFTGLGTVTAKADVTIDGYRGKQLTYGSLEEDVPGQCLEDADIWLLDVDGLHVLISSAVGGLDLEIPGSAVKAEIRQMVESIHFEH